MNRRMGSIDQTLSGRWRVRVTTPSGQRKAVDTFDTREEAETFLDAIEAVREGNRGHTVASWGEEWLDARELAKVVKDIEGSRGLFRKHIEKDPLGEMALRSVNRGHVNEWLGRVRAKGARSTAGNALTVLRGLFRGAADSGYIRLDPTLGVRLPREKRTKEPWTWLTTDEQAKLLENVPVPERYMVQFAIGSGLRAGELVGLELADVSDTTIVVRYGNKNHEATKTGKLRRVPMFGVARGAWKKWLAALPTYSKKNPRGLAFPRVRGGWRDSHHFFAWSQWKKWTSAIPRKLRFHDLRHTCASSLVSGVWGRSWSLEEVQALLGHSSISITQRYAHLAESALERAAKGTGLAKQRPKAKMPEAESLKEIKELTTGIEPATAGLQSPWRVSRFRELGTSIGQPWPRVWARLFLEAVARGDKTEAEALIEGIRAEMAGPFGVSIATELAGILAVRDKAEGEKGTGR